MKKLAYLFPFVLIFFSGCTQLPFQTSFQQTQAKDVKIELRVDTTSIQAGGKVGVSVIIENYADFEIRNISANVYGPPDWGGELGVTRTYSTVLYPEAGYEFLWKLKAPSDVEYKKYYQIFADLKYNGYNRKRAIITGVSYDYYKRIGGSSGITSSTSLGGPIEIDIVPYQTQLIAYEGDNLSFKFAVIISNKGRGKPCSDYFSLNCSDEKINKVLFSFKKETSNIEITCEKNKEINLIKSGSYAHFDCIGNLTDVKEVSTQIVEFLVNYTYIETLSSPSIAVEPIKL